MDGEDRPLVMSPLMRDGECLALRTTNSHVRIAVKIARLFNKVIIGSNT